MKKGLVAASDTELGFVRAGCGPGAVVLLHGWPQTSHAWREVQPLLAERLVSVALDLRGVGRSAPAATGYDKASMAEDVFDALEGLRIDRALVVGHGIGGMVGYALARIHPERIAGLMLVDTILPGLPGWDEAATSRAAWHLGFHSDGSHSGGALAELLVDGRQSVYFRAFIDRFAAHPSAITPDDLAEYVRGYEGRERLAAGFEMFRALVLDAEHNQTNQGPLSVPITAVFGEHSLGTFAATVASGLREVGAQDVHTALIEDCGHWPAEEKPVELARLILEFAARVDIGDTEERDERCQHM